MQNITVNTLFVDLIPLPAINSGATLTLTIRKASGGTLTGGTFTFLAGIQWKLTFTPATLNEVYAVEVLDVDSNIVFSQSYKALGSVYDATTGPTGNLVVGTNTWVTGQEAEDYFATRLNSETWTEATNTEKIQALIMAYRQLSAAAYSFPAVTVDAMKYAQYEQALFLLAYSSDIDARMALQAQGVIEAGIVKEKYSSLGAIPICVTAKSWVKNYEIIADNLFCGDVRRDEEYDADEEISEDN